MRLSEQYYPPNVLRICIDKQADGDFDGRIYNSAISEAIAFHGFSDLLIQADELFDRTGYPQSFQSKRSFRKKEPDYIPHCPQPQILTPVDQILKEKGNLETLDILVRTRQHATWQGEVFHRDGTKLGAFVSALELLKYIEML